MPSFSAPPRPCFALRVGVTGHRPGPRLPAGEVDRVTAEVASILDRLAEAARQAQKRYADVFDPAPPDLRLVSALAEGADRIAAKAALEAGWTLEVVLPFAREEYEQDFDSPDSKEAFRSLLGQASNVFCLAMPPAAAARPRAYEAAGHLTLDNCDILLTVWDGKPGRGRGGTPEIIADALERGVPVLHVHAADNAPPSLLRGERKPEELRADLAGLVGSLVAPPSDRSGLDRFLSEGGPDGAARDGRILGWWRFTGRLPAFARAFGGKPHDAGRLPEVGADRNKMGPGEAMLHDRYATADAISTHLGNVYRSAFTLVFLASAFAVLAGLAGVFWWHDPVVKASFVVLELGFIGVVLRLTQIGRQARMAPPLARNPPACRTAAGRGGPGAGRRGPADRPRQRAGCRRRLDGMVCAFVPARSAPAECDGRPGSSAQNGGRLRGRTDRRADPIPFGKHPKGCLRFITGWTGSA